MIKISLIQSVLAASSETVSDLGEALKPYPGGQAQIGTLIPKLYAVTIILAGVGILIFLVWGSIDWLTAGEDSEKIKSAQKKMTNAVIGLTILLGAWALWWLILHITGLKTRFSSINNRSQLHPTSTLPTPTSPPGIKLPLR